MLCAEINTTVDSAKNNANLNPIIFGSAPRSAMVVDKTSKMVHLIVTLSNCTFETFRKAILTYLGISDGASANSRYAGIFLDGSKSSQMKAKTADNVIKYVDMLDGSAYRKLYQVIILHNAT